MSGGEGGQARRYGRVIARRRSTIILMTVFVVVLVAIGSFAMRPVYRANVRILIDRENPNVVAVAPVLALDATENDYYQTQYRILQSRSLAKAVIQKTRLDAHPEFAAAPSRVAVWQRLVRPEATAERPEDAARVRDVRVLERFLRRLGVLPIRESRLVDVSFESHDPVLAARVANTVAEAYIEQDLASKFDASRHAVDWLNEQVADLRTKVEESEQALQRYQETNRVVSLGDRENVVLQRLNELNTALTRAKTERIGLETLHQQVRNVGQTPDLAEAIPAVIANPLIQALKADYVKLQADHSRLNEKYGEKHPEIVRVTSQLSLMRDKIRAEVQNIAKSIETEYRVAQSKEVSLAHALEGQKREALDLNEKTIRYGALKREAESNKQLFNVLLNRMKETNVTTGLATSNIRLVDNAEVPMRPVRPQKALNLALGLMAGLVLGTGLAFFAEHMDDSIRTPEDLEEHIGLPFLGPVPHVNVARRGPGAIDLVGTGHGAVAEAYRALRTSLLLSSSARPPQVLLVTSAQPAEGKSTVALNLGLVIAQGTQRVLVLDADQRRATLHRALEVSQSRGLSNVLAGDSDLADVIVPTPHANLWFLPSGPPPPNPSELLDSERLRAVIGEARTRFDRVVIDSPPVNAVTDAAIVSRVVDGVVLVVQVGRTGRDAVRFAARHLREVGATVLGVVLNKVDARAEGYYYGYTSDYYASEERRGRSEASAR